MMHTVVKSHRSGRDVVPKKFVDEICSVLQDADIGLRKYAIKDFRTYIPVKLKELGWSDNIYLDRTSKINITSMRGDIGLCMQTGNVSRIYADLLKLQALYMRETIKAGIVILPTVKAARSFSGNVASLERLERELPIFSQVITMPVVVIGFYE